MRELVTFEPFDWLQRAVEDHLDAGERAAAFCEFTRADRDDEGVPAPDDAILVLTDRNLRLMAFEAKRRRGRFERGPCTFSSSMPLGQIQGLAVTRVPPGVLRQAETWVDVKWSGGVESWGTPYVQGDQLVRLLEAHVARTSLARTPDGTSREIERLLALERDGVITQEEFLRGKELLLGRAHDPREDAVALLRQLHDLYKSGVLSESESNMKKWDVLSRR